jgi:hypothetical protein
MIQHENTGDNLQQGYNFTPLFHGSRHWLRVSEADKRAISSLGKSDTTTITDLDTGLKYRVYRRSCGLNCYCDAEIKAVRCSRSKTA